MLLQREAGELWNEGFSGAGEDAGVLIAIFVCITLD
jgi:hypothetical protein